MGSKPSITPFDYNALKKGKKRNKYGAKKVVDDPKYPGMRFDSQFEKRVYTELILREAQGEIHNIKTQVAVYLTDARILYRPDFTYELEGVTIYAEAKGFETAVWRIKRRLWKCYGPGILEIYKQRGKGTHLAETLTPK